jgi:hypothetical protein
MNLHELHTLFKWAGDEGVLLRLTWAGLSLIHKGRARKGLPDNIPWSELKSSLRVDLEARIKAFAKGQP